ncbi:MAG: hypothetical protein KC613_02495 [Myxococcales bacterium]|nr:hypothetical protein [Myxococcales bacterium]MCB9522358.1 hypothetical protein [Myxococcales bacterium]
MALGAPGALAEDAGKVVVLVFARGGVDENSGVRVERDLRVMFEASATEAPKKVPAVLAIEPRFDVGYLSKAHLERARRHFNDAQRALEKGEAEEALEQLFRSRRFYDRGIPFVQDRGLLRGIFFYYYLAHTAAKNPEKATEAYCEYVALTRNLAGNLGPLEQFEPLADKCGQTSIAGTAELKVTANIDGAHVYVDNRAVGVVGQDVPYVDPFVSAGPHLVEVRKAGRVRWGELVTLKKGESKSLRAKLKDARNRGEDFDPLASMPFEGDDAFSDVYISELLFQVSEKVHAEELVLGYLEPTPTGGRRLTVFDFVDGGAERRDYEVAAGLEGHRPALMKFWEQRFGAALDPADAMPSADRFAPTLFKVE